MQLYYHKDHQGNVGDDLNIWLWNKLLPNYFDGVCYHDPKLRAPLGVEDSLFVGIGTLLNNRIPLANKKAVFGSGVGYGPIPLINETWKIYCVRGALTAARLGLNKSIGVTDPAMLVRRVNLPKYAKKHPVSFMPHVSNARLSDWRHICNELGVYYIDPRNDVDKFLGELISSELILTEAMHGAILADALRVPWVPVSTAPHILDFKWNDWCGSVGVDYKPTRMTTLWSLPDGASIMGRAKHYFKYKIAYLELKKAIINSRPCLSEESKLSSCLDALEERLFDFKTDYERGRYR